MDSQQEIILDLVAALSIALASGWVAARFRLSPIFGYVVAGLIIGPFTPGFAADAERLGLLADIGVVFLLFGIGIQFSTKELFSTGRTTIALATVQVGLTLGLGYVAGIALGWDTLQSLFFGAAVALCSSSVMVKIISERGEEESQHGRIAITWSVVQDLLTVILVVMLGVASEGDADAGDIALTGLKIVGFLAGVLIIGARVVPWALEGVASVRSREIFLLAIASLALGTAVAASLVGISFALGAFLAGLIVSDSERSHQVLGEVLPARDIFAVLFFVVFGMLIDPAELTDGLHIFLIGFVLIVGAKFVLVAGPLLAFAQVPLRTAALAGVLVAQSAELTFILLNEGVEEGVVSESVFALTMAAAAASILAQPLLVAAAGRAPQVQLRRGVEPIETVPEVEVASHAVVSGYRSGGRFVAALLRDRQHPVVIVDEDRRLVEQLRTQGFVGIVGSIANLAVLQRLNLRYARLLVVVDPDPIVAEMAIRHAREIRPSLDILARAHGPAERERLERAGAREVVIAEQEEALELARHALTRYGVDRTQAAAIIHRLRGEPFLE